DYIGDYHGREPWVRIPSYSELIEIHERAAQPVHPTKVIGISLNTYDMDENAAREAVAKAAEETGLPATDPVRFDADVLVEAIIGAAAIVGREGDLAALATALTHPTTALGVATGRWLAVLLPLAPLTIACTAATGGHAGMIAAGLASAAAVGGCAVFVVLVL